MKHFALLLSALLALPVTAADLSDPTRPLDLRPVAVEPTSGAPASSSGRLEAILHSQARAVAIIDGKLLRVGDSLDGGRIEAIDNDSVRFIRAGRSITLRLARQAMKVRRDASAEDQP